MSGDTEGSGRRPGGPPWIRPEIQEGMSWRDGDVVISVPPKSGTTWTMNIVHQLLMGGVSDFEDIYVEVPWMEFLSYPGQPYQEVLDRIDAMPVERRRAFKTHSAPPVLPFVRESSGKDVKYIVVLRNPEEALVSFRPFLEQQTDEWRHLWGVPKEASTRPDFNSFYYEIIDALGSQRRFFGFLDAWWPLRHEKNVLFLHYSDMKKDHQGAIGSIAGFLGIRHRPEQWDAIYKYTSFDWMKQNEHLFEMRTLCEVPVLKSGGMVRKGRAGEAKSDGMTDEISQHLRQVGRQICVDEQAVNWFYDGGALPA